MNPPDNSAVSPLPTIKLHHPSSLHHPCSIATPTAGACRKISVAVDLSDESAFTVCWAVHNYIRPWYAVILLHVSPTSVLFGADWGPLPYHYSNSSSTEQPSQKQLEDDFNAFTASKVVDFAKPLKEAQIPYKIHIAKDHDIRERLCLEVERLGLSAVIMGSRGFGAVMCRYLIHEKRKSAENKKG